MAANDNPYIALLQQEQKPPGWAQILQHIGNLGFGLAGGFGQAAATGQPTMAAIGPGLMMGNQLNAQAAHQAEQERMKRLELQFQAQQYDDKRAEVLRKQQALEKLGTIGFGVTPQPDPLMGPNTTAQPSTAQPPPDIKTAGKPLADYLMAQHGLSPLAASTIVGNLYQESGFNPGATGDGGSSFGMAQWRADRQTGLRNFAATQNKPVTDPQVQIDYLVSEMKGGDMGAQRAWAGLQQAKTPEQANAAMMHFFRPAGYTPANPTGGHGYGQRVANTRALLPQGGPSDSTYAPVPTVDPYAVSAPPAGPAPRPGLGPRATPSPGGPQAPVTPSGAPIANAPPPPFMGGPDAPAGVPVAQGGGEGEVVLPRIGLPFPARPPAPAAPGSVPFPAVSSAPGGPVQPNYTPQPGQPTMAPGGGGPAPGGTDAPPVYVPPPPQGLTREENARLVLAVQGGAMTYEQAQSRAHQIIADKNTMAVSTAKARHDAAIEVYKQQQEGRRFDRGQEAQQWKILDPQNAQMMLGPGYDPTKAYQINAKGQIQPVGGAQTVVNINPGEQEFGKKMGEMDAKRFGDIIQAEGTMNDMASKLGFALEQFKQTYTGPGAESANAFYKTLGAFGFEEAAKKANAADAAMAVVAQMKPAMRAPGSGSSSDRDMDTFARALPSLLNLPDGNERITAYFQRMADRATRVRELAQEHSDGGKVPLTRTGFDKAVKDLGPLFTPDEIKEMTALGKTKPAGPKPPIGTFGATPQQTPAPPGSPLARPPIGSFGGGH